MILDTLINIPDQCINSFTTHHFRTIGTSVYVTVQAGLIAFVTQVDLQGFEYTAFDCRELAIN